MPRGKRRRPNGSVWYRSWDQCWYVTVGPKKTKVLGPNGEPVKGEQNEAEAAQCWSLMQIAEQGPAPPERDQGDLETAFELFLRHLAAKAEAKTVREYTKTLQDFSDAHPRYRAADVTPIHVTDWLDGHPTWGSMTRYTKILHLQAAFNWAGGPGGGLLSRNPIHGLRKPPAASRGRDAILSEESYRKMREKMPPNMRDVWDTLWDTGTRPGNVFRVEARHFHPEQGVWHLDTHKAYKKTGKPLIVILTPRVVEICRRLALQHPQGALYRTATGLNWEASNFSKRVQSYRKQLGITEKAIPYGARHRFGSAMLRNGAHDATVAALMGHRDTSMLHHHYGHLLDDVEHLRSTFDAFHAPSGARTHEAETTDRRGG